MTAPSPAKAHAHEMHEKAGSISNTCVRVPVRDDIKRRLSTKPGRGRTAPVCKFIIMTVADCSSAVASRRAKYDEDFRVQEEYEVKEAEPQVPSGKIFGCLDEGGQTLRLSLIP